MRAGGSRWPLGLFRPLADAGFVLCYAMGESACAVAGPRIELLGRAVPLFVRDPAEHGACPDVVLSIGTLPSLPGSIPQVVRALPATCLAMFAGFTIQPLGDGPLPALRVGAELPGFLADL